MFCYTKQVQATISSREIVNEISSFLNNEIAKFKLHSNFVDHEKYRRDTYDIKLYKNKYYAPFDFFF